jgi:hypothetical protein
MSKKLDQLIAEAMNLPVESRRRLARRIIESLPPSGVSDSSAEYRDTDWLTTKVLSKEIGGMTSVTFVLPDELAKRAQEAGLLSETSLAELISAALKEQGVDLTTNNNSPIQRRLVRQNNRLVVESLPGEQPISDADVRTLLNKLEW